MRWNIAILPLAITLAGCMGVVALVDVSRSIVVEVVDTGVRPVPEGRGPPTPEQRGGRLEFRHPPAPRGTSLVL